MFLRNATIGFINNFGQIPTQLFKKPHPQKKVAYTDSYSSVPGVTTQRLFYHSLDCLKVPQLPIKGHLSHVYPCLYNNDGCRSVSERCAVPREVKIISVVCLSSLLLSRCILKFVSALLSLMKEEDFLAKFIVSVDGFQTLERCVVSFRLLKC